MKWAPRERRPTGRGTAGPKLQGHATHQLGAGRGAQHAARPRDPPGARRDFRSAACAPEGRDCKRRGGPDIRTEYRLRASRRGPCHSRRTAPSSGRRPARAATASEQRIFNKSYVKSRRAVPNDSERIPSSSAAPGEASAVGAAESNVCRPWGVGMEGGAAP
jgi:hypothetical protein